MGWRVPNLTPLLITLRSSWNGSRAKAADNRDFKDYVLRSVNAVKQFILLIFPKPSAPNPTPQIFT